MGLERIAVIDTENASAAKYAHEFEFDVAILQTYSPLLFVQTIKEAEAANYQAIIIDSLSAAWEGKEGAMEMVDKETARSQSKNSYFAWGKVTPIHRQMIEAIVSSTAHIFATMRSKTEYALDTDEKTKKVRPRKIGLAPIQRAGTEYEFDVVGDMDIDHNLIISKTRCSALDGQVIPLPGAQIAATLNEWLAGAPAPEEIEPEDEGLGLSESTKAAMSGEDAPAEAPAQNGRGRMNPLVCQVLPRGHQACAAGRWPDSGQAGDI